MTTFSMQAKIDQDGKLRLELPVGLPPGDAEVLVIVQPGQKTSETSQTGPRTPSRSGLFDEANNLDLDLELEDMNRRWKSKLADV